MNPTIVPLGHCPAWVERVGYQIDWAWRPEGLWECFLHRNAVEVCFTPKRDQGSPVSVHWPGNPFDLWKGTSWRAFGMGFIERSRAAVGKASQAAEMVDDTLWEGRPAIKEFMTVSVLADGECRELSPLMVAVRDGKVTVGLRETDEGRWLWRAGSSFLEALEALEEALQDPTARWSAPSGASGRKSRRK